MSKNSHQQNFKALAEWLVSKKKWVITPDGYKNHKTKSKKEKIIEELEIN